MARRVLVTPPRCAVRSVSASLSMLALGEALKEVYLLFVDCASPWLIERDFFLSSSRTEKEAQKKQRGRASLCPAAPVRAASFYFLSKGSPLESLKLSVRIIIRSMSAQMPQPPSVTVWMMPMPIWPV